MNPVAKIVIYLLGIVLLGALLAPPLYWAGQAVADRGVFEFLGKTEFQKFFNRALLIAAIALLWPTIRWLRIASVRDLGLEPDPRWLRHLAVGFGIAVVLVATMAGIYIATGVYRWKSELPWDKVPGLAVTAIVVAILEESLFRGGILGLFRRAMQPWKALFWATALFAIVHFLKPDDEIRVDVVTWLSGFSLLPHVFHQFTEPMTVLASFTTIFVLGWVLGYATLRTRALWMSIGLHAGVVFVKMSFSKFTKRQNEYLPWIGSELQIGLVPVAVLALAGVLVWYSLHRESTHHASTRA